MIDVLSMEISGYKIVRTLGQGGMATVYLAIQESFEREVALKVISPALSADPRFGERFLSEARIVSRLVHPNIVTVHDVGVENGQHFLSMEYVPGQELKQLYHQLSLKQRLRVIKEVAKALDYAGRKGYVHRDVKPENIMLHEEDSRAILMDFGIARSAQACSGMTQTGTAIGTPHYMSPEQARGKAVDGRSDLYSLGVVLYLLLEGRVPYDADSAVAVGIKHVSAPIPTLKSGLSRIQPVIDKVLAKDPAQRYQSGDELIADLEAISDAELEQMEALVAGVETELLLETDEDAPTVVSPRVGEIDRIRAFREEPLSAGSGIQVTTDEREGDGVGEEIDAAHEFLAVSEDERKERSLQAEGGGSAPWLLGLVAAIVIGLGLFYYRGLLPLDILSQIESLGAQAGVAGARILDSPDSGGEQNVLDDSLSLAKETGDQPQEPVNDNPVEEGEQWLAPVREPESESVEPEVDGTAMTALLESRIQQLQTALESDPAAATALATAYRDILVREADNPEAQEGLKNLRLQLTDELRRALEARDFVEARRYMDIVKTIFPQVETDPGIQELAEKLFRDETIQAQLSRAQQLLEKDALTSPDGDNALESFQEVLKLAPKNAEAHEGIRKIVKRYGRLSQSQLERGNFPRALALVEKGLLVAPRDSRLLKLRERINGGKKLQARAKALIAQAQALLVAGKLIGSGEENAHTVFHSVLTLSSEPAALLATYRTKAEAGIDEIEARLDRQLTTLIESGKLAEAESLLSAARDLYPESAAFLARQAGLEVAIQAAIEARRPKVEQILVSHTPLSSIDDPQASSLKVDRTIHIGFRYRNFQEDTSVVQAVLFDGARSLQIAQVPVIVSGKGGVKFFRIDRPVDGFADGGYNVDLLLGGERLNTATFQVDTGAGQVDASVGL